MPAPPTAANPLRLESEEIVYELDAIFDGYRTAISHMAVEQALNLFAPDFRGATPFDPWDSFATERFPQIGVLRDTRIVPPPHATAAELPARIAEFLAPVDSLSYALVKVVAVEGHSGDELRAVTKWVLRGEAADGPFDLVEKFHSRFVRAAGAWLLAEQSRAEGYRLRSAAPAFREVSKALGVAVPAGMRCLRMTDRQIAEGRRELGIAPVPGESCHGCTYRTPLLHLGGVAVGDANADGWPDLYVVRAGPNLLLENRQGRSFADVTASAGVGHPGLGTGAIWLDYDNDGDEDLITTALCGVTENDCLGSCVVALRNRGDGTFEDDTARAGLERHGNAYSLTAADVDRDGLLDVYVAFYGHKDAATRELTYGPGAESFLDASNGEPDALFLNLGDGRFREAAAESGLAETRWGLACLFFDADDDGDPDLYVVNDFGPNAMYWNRGDGTFEERSLGLQDAGFGMGIALGDVDRDGRLDVHVSNMFSTAGARVLAASPELSAEVRSRMEKARQGNTLLRNLGGGQFEDVGGAAGIRSSGWAWGCAFLDTANRGALDLYVANGFLTGVSRLDL